MLATILSVCGAFGLAAIAAMWRNSNTQAAEAAKQTEQISGLRRDLSNVAGEWKAEREEQREELTRVAQNAHTALATADLARMRAEEAHRRADELNHRLNQGNR